MGDWEEYSGPMTMLGIRILQKEAEGRQAMVSVSPMPDGTQVLSLTLSLACTTEQAQRFGASLLAEHQHLAVRGS